MNREQITPAHRARSAYVYVRQSSDHQVRVHRESQRRQRNLADRAVALGWPSESVVVLDEDLGESATRSNERSGFQNLITETALGRVGIILSLEVSRLSRGNASWYHLLDICAVMDTLIADTDGLYDPRRYNDRLLLGLKGTMSEAELHIMKQRLLEGLRAKAKRGAFQFRLPPGFYWDEAGRIQKDPDEQIRSTIARIFERFERLGTVHQVQVSLVEDGHQVPARSGPGHRVKWSCPSQGYVLRMLKNPIYAGAYAYGRRQMEETLDDQQRVIKRMREREREDWHALIHDHHEGYISWERYERNQRQIRANRKSAGPGAPREGWSLMQGLVLCGRCGRRMAVRYDKGGGSLRFACAAARRQTGGPICQAFGGMRLERALEERVLDALEPCGIDAMVEAAAACVRAGQEEREQWRQRIERAHYEVDLARRQYDAVDPANRLVARELERRFEAALEAVRAIEARAETRRKSFERPLTDADHERLRRYARDLPRLWRAPTTRHQDRKRIVRMLVEHVVVTVPTEGETIEAAIHWRSGEVTPLAFNKGKRGITGHVATPDLVALLRTLAREFSDAQIARIFSRRGQKTPKGLPFTANRVAVMRNNHGIPKGTPVPRRGEHIYTAREAGEILGVCGSTVIRWVDVGLLKGARLTEGAPWRVQVTPEDVRRLTARDAPGGWLTLKKAALALGVSQQTVLQRLNTGKLEGVRVQRGRRCAWRIRVPATPCDDPTTLFE